MALSGERYLWKLCIQYLSGLEFFLLTWLQYSLACAQIFSLLIDKFLLAVISIDVSFQSIFLTVFMFAVSVEYRSESFLFRDVDQNESSLSLILSTSYT